jgi:hypothetical protein
MLPLVNVQQLPAWHVVLLRGTFIRWRRTTCSSPVTNLVSAFAFGGNK